MAKIVQFQNEPKPETDNSKPGPATFETYRIVMSHDRSGRAFSLYCFYAMRAFDNDEGQPYCTDEWTAEQMHWDFKTVMSAKKKLMEAKAIRMITKGRKRYIQVQYLPFKVSNSKHRSLSTENIPASVMGTIGVFDFFARWYDSIQGNPTRFIKAVTKKVRQEIPKDKLLQYLEAVYAKISCTGYGIEDVNNELSFFYYLVAGVTKKIKPT